ncbi:MAG: XdhC family protein [Spirochaetes bacterium]|nr:XdhC family protein [Spirochaetota bacterium]
MDREMLEKTAASRTPFVLVTIVEVKGSAPRHPGSSMLVRPSGDPSGAIEGTIGGGKGEARAIEAALTAIKDKKSSFIEVKMLSDDPEGKELICGGVNRMLVEYIGDTALYAAAAKAVSSGKRVVFTKDLKDLGKGVVRIAVRKEGFEFIEESAAKALLSGAAAFLESESLFLDPALPEEKLLILGAGHVGKALAKAANGLGWAITVADDREEFASRERFDPEIAVRLGGYEEVIESFPFDPATYAVILSRGHLFDLECARAVLKRTYRYLGLIGSKRKVALLREQLAKDGFDEKTVATLHAPIGIDIGAETPGEIAISILAEMIAVRRQTQIH